MDNSSAHFSMLPDVAMQRSRFTRDCRHLTTMNAGDLIPLFVDADVLPGDTIDIGATILARMQTPLRPVMDDAYIDIYWFFCPHRLVWDHWQAFWGQNDSTYWTQPTVYSVPQLIAPIGANPGWHTGDLADYFGIPIDVPGISVNALPFRAYSLIWNEWFRNQNTDNPSYFYKGDTDLVGYSGSSYDPIYGAAPAKVTRFHDYFSSALPQPQKGPAVDLAFSQNLPVYALTENTDPLPASADPGEDSSLRWRPIDPADGTPGTPARYSNLYAVGKSAGNDLDNGRGRATATNTSNNSQPGSTAYMLPANLWALSEGVSMYTINELRQAFAVQRYYEQLARSGSRYTEFVQSFFKVKSQDARLQRPEYLGGTRININMQQVVQTSSGVAGSPQGSTAGISVTQDGRSHCVYSAQEHGTIMCLACIRHNRSYQQGIERMWSRRDRLDYYLPTFANLGEQAILNKEIYAQGSAGGDDDEEVFGYQEAWAEYRYKPSRISGEMRSTSPAPLDSWHYGDYYNQLPVLSQGWMAEGTAEIDRTLQVGSSDANQFLIDAYFPSTWTRPMPLYSVPGLIDHF